MAAESSLEQEALRRREKLKALREKSALAAQVRVFLILQYYNVYVSFIYIYSDILHCVAGCSRYDYIMSPFDIKFDAVYECYVLY